MKTVRIFLSSPGDVAAERNVVRRLVKDQLPVDPFLRGKVNLDLVSWDDPEAPASLHAHLTPQVAIDRGMPTPSECDIVVVILWSRLGTILPSTLLKPDGTRYLSGTEWEYLNAFEAARQRDSPAILVYRNTSIPTFSLTATETERFAAVEQWEAVEKFFAGFQSADGALVGGTHKYSELADFEKQISYHLRTELNIILNREAPAQVENQTQAAGALLPPRFQNAVLRMDDVDKLVELHAASSILIITGLAGNGKSFIASQLATRLTQGPVIQTPLWVECESKESLESLFAQLSRSFPLTSRTPKSRCRELITQLAQHNAVLILDDYQASDREAMEPLLAASAAMGAPARLILVSRVIPDEALALPEVSVKPVSDFTVAEAEALLKQRGITELDDAVGRELLIKTGALPLALALFCALVNLGGEPQRLLNGDLLHHERLRKWFDLLVESLTPGAQRLLGLLSLVDGAFDDAVIRMFGTGIGETEIRRDFGGLERAFLVMRYDRDRWRIHDLVGSLGRTSLSEATVRSTHAELGSYYFALAVQARKSTNQDRYLEFLIKACRAFDRSTNRENQLERALEDLARVAKLRGAHALFLELSRNIVLVRGVTSPWLYYHFAHCCSVLGLYDDAMEHSRRILQLSAKVSPTLRLSASRLYAEALVAMGQLEKARETLIDALYAVRRLSPEPTSMAQAESVLAGIETKLGLTQSAHERINRLGALQRTLSDPLGEGVALSRMGFLQVNLKLWHEASNSFDRARHLFRASRDPRGESWTLWGSALAAFGGGRELDCEDNLRQAATLHEAIGAYDPDYEAAILLMLESAKSPGLIELLQNERVRIEAVKSELRSFARRLNSF